MKYEDPIQDILVGGKKWILNRTGETTSEEFNP